MVKTERMVIDMKRVVILLITAAVLFSLTACGGEKNDGTQGILSDAKVLVAYFSMVGNADFPSDADAVTSSTIKIVGGEIVGNNRVIANMVVDLTGGDLYPIRTVKTYPSNDREIIAEAMAENMADERPELSGRVENLSDYGLVILIYPNWSDSIPKAVSVFLEEHDFSGITIAPVCSYGGSGLGRSVEAIKALCPSANVLDALGIQASLVEVAINDIETWIKEMG